MKNDQFAVYRVDRHSEGRDLWHLSYQEAVSRRLAIRIEYYRQMDIRPLLAGESAIALWKRMKESCEVSDVLVLNQNGEIHCYYVNEDYPQLLSGFIRLNPSGTLVTLDTENYRISGKPGNWMATDDIIIDGKQFYLMEHQEYHRQVAYIILDSYGKMIMEECKNGFDEKTKQKLHELMKTPEQREQEYQKYKERLEHYQKFFENGTYERSWESGTEENYNMVDGQVNNLKKCRREKCGKKAGTEAIPILKKETKEKRVSNQEITGKTDCNRCEIWKTGTEIFGAGDGKEERLNAMKLSKYEKETIILTNEEDRYYSVYTFNQGLQKRLKNFAERYPECCYLSNSTKEGSETYIIQKGRLSLNLRPPYAKERIQKALETIQIAREEKSDDS